MGSKNASLIPMGMKWGYLLKKSDISQKKCDFLQIKKVHKKSPYDKHMGFIQSDSVQITYANVLETNRQRLTGQQKIPEKR